MLSPTATGAVSLDPEAAVVVLQSLGTAPCLLRLPRTAIAAQTTPGGDDAPAATWSVPPTPETPTAAKTNGVPEQVVSTAPVLRHGSFALCLLAASWLMKPHHLAFQ